MFQEVNKADVLEFLRQNKKADRFVPDWITDNDTERVNRLSAVLKDWMDSHVPQQAIRNIRDLLGRRNIAAPAADR